MKNAAPRNAAAPPVQARSLVPVNCSQSKRGGAVFAAGAVGPRATDGNEIVGSGGGERGAAGCEAKVGAGGGGNCDSGNEPMVGGTATGGVAVADGGEVRGAITAGGTSANAA